MANEFKISREVELAATPEEVWEAIATGPGNAAWLFPGEIEPREGGRADLGTVTVWDPPHRFSVRDEGEDGWFNAVESVIEARAGGTTVLRYVHSGIFVEDWDDQFDAASRHTDFYLHTLGQYLEHFTGRTAVYVGGGPDGVNGPAGSATPEGFETLKRALGVTDGVGEGDTVQRDLEGVGAFEGVVDYVSPYFLGIRTADGLYRFFGRNAWGLPVGMSVHMFAPDADAGQVQEDWQGWLNRQF